MNGSHHKPITKFTLSTVRKDEWDTKEGTGKSMKNALYGMEKGTLGLNQYRTAKNTRVMLV